MPHAGVGIQISLEKVWLQPTGWCRSCLYVQAKADWQSLGSRIWPSEVQMSPEWWVFHSELDITVGLRPQVCCVCTGRAAAMLYQIKPDLQGDSETAHFGWASEAGNHRMSSHISTTVGPCSKSKKEQNSAHQARKSSSILLQCASSALCLPGKGERHTVWCTMAEQVLRVTLELSSNKLRTGTSAQIKLLPPTHLLTFSCQTYLLTT